MPVTWRGPEVIKEIEQRLIGALNEIDGRIETKAKEELYPGHGKLSGALQRSIQSEPARSDGRRVRGAVKTKGIPYAKRLHDRYQFIIIGLNAVRPQAVGIVRQHVGRGG